jgi:tRNA G18 (ribose-2'-O)-methylase SpoU
MALIPIDDPDDPRLEPFRAIQERDLVGRQGRFILEGEIVLRLAAARSLHRIEALLIADNRVAKLADLIAGQPETVPVLVAPSAILSAAAGFAVHRGVLAIGVRCGPASARDLIEALPASALVVALCGLANHDNVGGVFRNAAAFGADAILLDGACCDPLYRKAIRVSAGAATVTPFHRGGSAETLCALLEEQGFTLTLTSPRGRTDVTALAPARRRAVVIGAEGAGLPEALLERFETARIAMAPGIDSLNAAAASAIVLHHAANARLVT